MPWSTSTFSLLYDFVARRDAGNPTNIIGATEVQAQFQDLADGLEACVKANGDIAATANLPMGGFAHTNVAAATARTQYARVTEVQDGVIFKAASAGGTIDAMTGTLAPAITAYVTGMLVSIVAPGTGSNTTTTPTLQLNGIASPKTIRKHQGALTVGDYTVGDTLLLMYDGTGFELLNPKNAVTVAATAIDLNGLTTDSTIGATGDFIPFVDVSGSNSSDKGTVQSLFTNVFANFTADTTGGASADKLLFSDASESDAAQTVTVGNFVVNSLQHLTTDATGGDVADYIPVVDVSDSNAGNKTLVSDVLYNAMNSATADAAPDMAADHVLSRDNSASAAKKVLMQYIGAGKQTIWVPAAAMTANTTNGPASGTTESASNKVMNKLLDFDQTTSESAQFTVSFPKSWNLGTVTFIPYWTAASGTGTVIWALSGVAISNDEVIDASFGTAQTSTDTLLATTDVHVGPESSAITIGGTPAADDIVYFKLARDISDTLNADARLIGIRVIYTTSVNTDN